jgi:hypothetical protein
MMEESDEDEDHHHEGCSLADKMKQIQQKRQRQDETACDLQWETCSDQWENRMAFDMEFPPGDNDGGDGINDSSFRFPDLSAASQRVRDQCCLDCGSRHTREFVETKTSDMFLADRTVFNVDLEAMANIICDTKCKKRCVNDVGLLAVIELRK